MWGVLNGVITLLGLLVFLAIVWWAFSAGRKSDNEAAAQLPFSLEDEEYVDAYQQRED